MKRRDFLSALGAGAALAALPRSLRAAGAGTPMTVYKDPNCGCCKEWVKLAQKAGFDVKVVEMANGPGFIAFKKSKGVGESLQSCHTALVGGYTIEGHVPLDLIRKLLAVKPKVVGLTSVAGLTVPGMVVGSPGMEAGDRKDRYDVIVFDALGKTKVFASR